MTSLPPSARKELCLQSEAILCAYVQIPFCRVACDFCCWRLRYHPEQLRSIDRYRNDYLEALKTEIRLRSETRREEREAVDLAVIHFGGGTPSLLKPIELQGILDFLTACYGQQLDKIETIGLECRPDDLNPALLRELRAVGFNRISLGVQSFDQRILERIGRHASAERSMQAYAWIREAGFPEVNIDLLYGFPFQTLEEIETDVQIAARLGPEHLDVHPWKPVPGSLARECGDYTAYRARLIRAAGRIRELLASFDYYNYNHRCFSRPGRENLMHLVEATYLLPWLAFGAGVEQYLAPDNPPDIDEYIRSPFPEKMATARSHLLPPSDLITIIHAMIRQLLLPEGIHVPFLNRRYHCDLDRLLAYFSCPENLQREIDRYSDLLLHMYQASRIQILKKIVRWREQGILEQRGYYLTLGEAHRICPETWALYLEAC